MDRADFQQQLDQQEREERTLNTLARVAAAGLHDEADFLARETGVWSLWTKPIKQLHERTRA